MPNKKKNKIKALKAMKKGAKRIGKSMKVKGTITIGKYILKKS